MESKITPLSKPAIEGEGRLGLRVAAINIYIHIHTHTHIYIYISVRVYMRIQCSYFLNLPRIRSPIILGLRAVTHNFVKLL